jgi:hypothetical protein
LQNAGVFPKLGPDTKLLLVLPVWCTKQTYEEWLQLNRGNFSFVRCESPPPRPCYAPLLRLLLQHAVTRLTLLLLSTILRVEPAQYTNWAFADPRIVGFDPWPLHSNKALGATTSEALGLADMPETLAWYSELGKAIVTAAARPALQ